MIKRLAVGVLVAGLVSAGAAFANTFTLNGNTGQAEQAWIATGDSDVESCDPNVEAQVFPGNFISQSDGHGVRGVKLHTNPSCYDGTMGDWEAIVTLISSSNPPCTVPAVAVGGQLVNVATSSCGFSTAELVGVSVTLDQVTPVV